MEGVECGLVRRGGIVEVESRLDIEMRESGEGKRMLNEIEQNYKAGQEEITEGSTKIGSWKRKARAKGKKKGICNVLGTKRRRVGILGVEKKDSA